MMPRIRTIAFLMLLAGLSLGIFASRTLRAMGPYGEEASAGRGQPRIEQMTDYYQSYYDEITYLAGFRPGVRWVIPLLFHRSLYFRGALPIQYTIDDENLWVVGLLLGVGFEWHWQQVGFFVEADIMPYFLEIYPGYYVIPVHGRAGVSLRF